VNTSDFIKDKQEQVLNYYGLEVTHNRHIDCVCCGKTKKMRICWFQGDIRAICVCASYSLLDLLMELTGQDFATLAKEIDVTFGNTDREPVKPKDTNRRDQAIALFRSSAPLRGTDAEVYLQSRGIYELPTGGVKFGTVYDHTEGRRIPAMIALASTEFTEPRQMHCTYIENGKKADIATQRKMYSLAPATLRDKPSSEPVAIKLFPASNVLGIAEGIESALSAKQLYRIPTWAAMNATYLKRFRAPTGVTTLYIFADNDSSLTGLAAAMSCGRSNLLSSNDVQKVVIRWPEKVGDFNDVVVEGDEVLEWIGSR
jgi:putative DNA primase/helicase